MRHFVMISAHVWHSLSANIQDPHLVQRITGSCVSVDSARFFVPTAQHLRHWNTLKPSASGYPSSHSNSVLAEQKLHLKLTKIAPLLTHSLSNTWKSFRSDTRSFSFRLTPSIGIPSRHCFTTFIDSPSLRINLVSCFK